MATTTATARRNDRCPCGSGRKYKNCCARKKAPPAWWLIAIWVAVGLAVGFAALSWIRGARSAGDGPACPPGQVWSSEHGHCH